MSAESLFGLRIPFVLLFAAFAVLLAWAALRRAE
jgi:hypothetical protein